MAEILLVARGLLFAGLVFGSLLVWTVIASRAIRRQPLVEYEPRVSVPWSGVDVLVLLLSAIMFQGIAEVWASQAGITQAGTFSPQTAAITGAARCLWLAFAMAYLVWFRANEEDLGFSPRSIGY